MKSVKFITILFVGLCYFQSAVAYLDPGIGSLILQILIAGIMGTILTLQICHYLRHSLSQFINTLDSSQHLIGNIEVHLAGDIATTRCNLQAQHTREIPEGGNNLTFGCVYRDELLYCRFDGVLKGDTILSVANKAGYEIDIASGDNYQNIPHQLKRPVSQILYEGKLRRFLDRIQTPANSADIYP